MFEYKREQEQAILKALIYGKWSPSRAEMGDNVMIMKNIFANKWQFWLKTMVFMQKVITYWFPTKFIFSPKIGDYLSPKIVIITLTADLE
jgi:hypothetical protein